MDDFSDFFNDEPPEPQKPQVTDLPRGMNVRGKSILSSRRPQRPYKSSEERYISSLMNLTANYTLFDSPNLKITASGVHDLEINFWSQENFQIPKKANVTKQISALIRNYLKNIYRSPNSITYSFNKNGSLDINSLLQDMSSVVSSVANMEVGKIVSYEQGDEIKYTSQLSVPTDYQQWYDLVKYFARHLTNIVPGKLKFIDCFKPEMMKKFKYEDTREFKGVIGVLYALYDFKNTDLDSLDEKEYYSVFDKAFEAVRFYMKTFNCGDSDFLKPEIDKVIREMKDHLSTFINNCGYELDSPIDGDEIISDIEVYEYNLASLMVCQKMLLHISHLNDLDGIVKYKREIVQNLLKIRELNRYIWEGVIKGDLGLRLRQIQEKLSS